MLPQAREAVEALPERNGLVFRTKRGLRLSQPTMSGYWSQVLARARLDFDFYLATKHYGVHHTRSGNMRVLRGGQSQPQPR